MRRAATILAGVLCLAAPSARTQSQNSSKPAAPDSSGTATAATKKKSKKVWTNEEIAKVHGPVSVVGQASAPDKQIAEKDDGAATSDDARQQQIDHYKKQLAQLQSQIDSIDKRISQLQNFKGQNTDPSGGININQGYNMVPVPDQIKQLEDKKKQLRAKMDEVETDARKNGITAGDLR